LECGDELPLSFLSRTPSEKKESGVKTPHSITSEKKESGDESPHSKTEGANPQS
jgi:hypothetical protein